MSHPPPVLSTTSADHGDRHDSLAPAASSELAPVGAARVQEVIREHGPYVARSLRFLGVPPAELEDACQEVFIVVMRRLDSFEGRSSLRTWLYGICVRTSRDLRKRAARRGRDRDPLQHEPPGASWAARPDEAEEQRRARATALKVLDALDDDKRAVFVLFEIEGIPMVEVASALDCPLQTAYSRLKAAREIVQKKARQLTAMERR